MKFNLPLSLLALGCSVLVLSGLPACTKTDLLETRDNRVDYYTCSMHPSVRSHDRHAKCPLCSMDLIAVLKKGAEPAGKIPAAELATEAEFPPSASGVPPDQPGEFTIPLDRQQLIGVTYAKVTRTPIRSVIRTVGIVAVDKQRHWDYVARIDGYVQNLKVFAPGETVQKDQVLMEIYSPDLVATQNEFIDLLRMRDQAEKNGSTSTKENAEHLLSSARQRLSRWNLGETQIDALSESRATTDLLPLTSPFRGVVAAIGVDQGRRVMTGDHLVDIDDLSSVWVWVDFYQEELSQIKPGLAVSLTSSALPGEKLTGIISLVDPFLNESKRTGRVRLDVENPLLKLRPNMYVDAEVSVDHGDALTVPVNSVLPTGKHNLVFVDRGAGKLEPRFVDLGGKFGEVYSVTSGLEENERVVSSANFLVDAESKIQGALKSW